MNRETIINKVYQAIRETLNDQNIELTPLSNLVEDLEMDSVDGITLIMDLEEACNLTIEDKELVNFTTIESIVDFIEKSQQQNEEV